MTTSTATKVAAIVNPAAGRRRAVKLWVDVADELRRHDIEVATFLTTAPGDATILSRSAIDRGYTTVVAVGGDGTVHEVVNGFVEHERIREEASLGILPAGTGMDFARNVGAKKGARAATERILRGRERRIDLGMVEGNGQVFVNFAETGLGGAVVERERELSAAWPGRASFFLAAVRAAMDEDNTEMRILVDRDLVYHGPAVSVIVSNGRYFGGGMKVAPHARVDDGLFDVFVLGDFTRLELVSQIWKIYPGVHTGYKKVLWKRGHSVQVDAPHQALLDLDGELKGAGPVRMAVVPSSLRVLV